MSAPEEGAASEAAALARRRRGRNLAVLALLGALALLFYFITLARLGS